jgi:macrodomain Ter protein organizer (MatP/YcbG family)
MYANRKRFFQALHDFRRKQSEDLQAEMQAEVTRRLALKNETGPTVVKSTPVSRIRIVDVSGGQPIRTGLVSIWFRFC